MHEPLESPVYVDLGFLVRSCTTAFHTSTAHCCSDHFLQRASRPSPSLTQVTSKYGAEESKASVDYGLYNPDGTLLQHENGVSEGEVGIHAKGGQGPWRVCFRVSSGALLKPSVIVKLTYFVVNYDEYIGDSFDWEEEDASLPPKPHIDNLGTKDQIESLEHGLLRLDHYLHNVTNEQRYLYARTVRHLKTAESTLRRTFWYYLALYFVIAAASFSQLVVVRLMFKKVRPVGGSCCVLLVVSVGYRRWWRWDGVRPADLFLFASYAQSRKQGLII